MTTDPGDLVLDPTCGSGTTAYVAEQWGRRWITLDTSRVALALARQRLLTSKLDFYKLREVGRGVPTAPGGGSLGTASPTSASPANGFICKAVPHITLKSIAQNVALDAIFAKHQPVLDDKLAALNKELQKVSADVRQKLNAKLLGKEKREGKKAVTEADRRRWSLPKLTEGNEGSNATASSLPSLPSVQASGWREWEVPFDTDEDWPAGLQSALKDYRGAWRAKMDEVNACIAASVEQEELVDKPQIARGVVRVSGPFTMEAVMPVEEGLEIETPISGEPGELETFAGDDVRSLASSSAKSQGLVTSSPTGAAALMSSADAPHRSTAHAGKIKLPLEEACRFPRKSARHAWLGVVPQPGECS